MKLNIAVCGKFHYHNYVRYVDQAGLLNRFYYSHSIRTSGRRLGIASGRAINCWPKEYLIRLHAQLTNGWLVPQLAPFYSQLWQIGVLQRWNSCGLLHVMLHGTAHRLIRRAKREGAVVIGEPVNRHPEDLYQLLCEESERWGMRRPTMHKTQQLQIAEAALADFLLTPSRMVRDSFVQHGFDPARTRVIPYGVDLSRFKPLSNGMGSGRPFRVICVAQLSLRKGHLYLLEAWKKLRLRNAELLFIGAVSYEMSSILRRYAGMFRHIPFVPNHELPKEYARSSVFVLPSIEDGFGYVIGEALACALPVITTVNAGGGEIISHQRDGFLVPIRCPEAIAERLEFLYRNEEARKEMACAAVDKARSELSWEIYFQRLRRLYSSLLHHGERMPSRKGGMSEPREADSANYS